MYDKVAQPKEELREEVRSVHASFFDEPSKPSRWRSRGRGVVEPFPCIVGDMTVVKAVVLFKHYRCPESVEIVRVSSPGQRRVGRLDPQILDVDTLRPLLHILPHLQHLVLALPDRKIVPDLTDHLDRAELLERSETLDDDGSNDPLDVRANAGSVVAGVSGEVGQRLVDEGFDGGGVGVAKPAFEDVAVVVTLGHRGVLRFSIGPGGRRVVVGVGADGRVGHVGRSE